MPSRPQTTPRSNPGLKINRYFTKPGKHPYDQIDWALRSALINNERGEMVFEQADVEAPADWSQLAINIVVSKYFRGHLGTPERETSVKQMIDRVTNTIAGWGRADGYFASDKDGDAFEQELRHLLVNQMMAFNSPVWFNVGWRDHAQTSACFINSVEDDMGSIMDLAKTEAMLFKFGSGAGVNLSKIRGSGEKLSGGGTASGPLSFMKGYDSFAGVVKSGGSTRRAAKMIVLDADHPDVEDFIESKVREERKAHALIAAGYDSSFTGEAYQSVQYQNANHSVRVTDDFMRAVEADGAWQLTARTDGAVMKELRARQLLRQMAQAAWASGDPGIQYDTTINDWHTCANTDRIYASNPCVTGDTLVATDLGWRRIDSLVGQKANIIGADGQPHPVDKIFPTGTKPVFELKTKSGYRVRITEDHLVATQRGDVAVKNLQLDDSIFLNAPRFGADSISSELAEAIGLSVGDGCLATSTVGTRKMRQIILTMHSNEAPILERIAIELNDQRELLRAVGENPRPGSVHVRMGPTGSRLAFGSRTVVNKVLRYAVMDKGAVGKAFTDAAFSLDRPSMAALLRGLFTADGTVGNSGDKSQYVALDSSSLELLLQVQRMLLAFGVKAKIYEDRRAGKLTAMLPDGKGGMKEYSVKEMHSLRISAASRVLFEKEIGFAPESAKAAALHLVNRTVGTYSDELIDRVKSITPLGDEAVYDLTEYATQHFVANGLVIHNCSEYLFLNDSACNLASLNLMKFEAADGEGFDVAAYRQAVRITSTAMEILVGNSSYPTEKIAKNSHDYRPLGLGYANLGAYLMTKGLAYDSDHGRAIAAGLTAIMGGEAYAQSARIARDCGGPFAGYEKNREPMLRVIGKHRTAAFQMPDSPLSIIAYETWDEALELGEKYGYRNAQASVLAPTGTIAFLMDCATTGVEPDIALIKYKKLVGEGYLRLVNESVPEALRTLDYDDEQVAAIIAYIDEHETIEGAPELDPAHLSIFDCAFKPANGSRSIEPMGHVRMMAAVQPFISGAISKTINLPEAASVEDVEKVYLEGWKLGLKALAIYRDNSKKSQPLNTGKKTTVVVGDNVSGDVAASLQQHIEELEGALEVALEQLHEVESTKTVVPTPKRRRLDQDRNSYTHKFSVGGHEGYLIIGLYPEGEPGEIFIKMAKEGSTVSGFTDAWATSLSIALQYGVPLRDLIGKFAHSRFEPSGFTINRDIPMAKSIVDYVARYLGSRFLTAEERSALGVLDRSGPDGGPMMMVDAASPAAAPTPLKSAPAAAPESPSVASAEASLSDLAAQTGDTPPCPSCGSLTVRSGTCATCLSCGTTTGCS